MNAHGQDGHGGDIWGAARRKGVPLRHILDFSASINPLGISPKAQRRLKREIALAAHYPDREQEELRGLVAFREGIPPDCILFGNGATQLIHLIPQALPCQKALVVEPSFSEYRAALELCGTAVVELPCRPESGFQPDPEALLRMLKSEQPGMVFLANPNNPAGAPVPRETVLRVVKFCASRRITVVLDESFIEFTGEPSLAPVAARQPRVLVLRSFTKCFALAGLRIGYLAAHRSMVKRIARLMEPWSVNTLALAAATESLKDTGHLSRSLTLIRKERRYLSRRLASLGWLRPFPSESNYLLVQIQANGLDGFELRRKLEVQDVLIRDAAGFRGLGSRFIRIAVRNRKQNDFLIARLNDIGRALRLNCEPEV